MLGGICHHTGPCRLLGISRGRGSLQLAKLLVAPTDEDIFPQITENHLPFRHLTPHFALCYNKTELEGIVPSYNIPGPERYDR